MSQQIKYLQEQHMAGKAEVLAAIAAEREEVLEAIRKAVDENQPEDLSDLVAAVQGIYQNSPVDAPAEDAPAEDAPAEDAPAEDAPAEDAPAEDAPAEDLPASDGVAQDNSGTDVQGRNTNPD
jgi:hypothetical protein